MAVYMIIDNEITDPALFAEYADKAHEVVEAHGGKYLARGGAVEIVHGAPTPHRVVVIEFESIEKARAYANSDEYKQIADLRDRGSVTTSFTVEGV